MATEDNVVFVGKKPSMNYVLAVTTQFNNGSKHVVVKARGTAISKAVDVVEISRRRFITDAKVKGIDISTEDIKTDEGETIKVSSIEISLSK
ncbi:MAG: DNA-binding protein Alba [Candidatus Hydrothermarchaeaceae archaeon]